MEKAFLEICKENNVMGASCMVVKNNEIQECVSYGYANFETKKLMSENVVYRIASVSKLLVGTCIMQLVEKGKLDLDKDVSEYLGFNLRNPKYPNKVINLKMVMTHTASICDGQEAGVNSDKDTGYNSLNGTPEDVYIEDMLIPGRKHFVPETFSEYEPGTHYEYSNFCCGILACILERVEKVYFFDYFKVNVANRLGIKASFVSGDMDVENIGSSYYRDGSLYRSNEKFFNTSVRKRPLGNNYVGPAGGLYISMADLNKVMNCFMNDGLNLLKKETMDRMLQMTWYGDKSGSCTARGIQFEILDCFPNKRLYGHFGCAYNVRTFLFFNPIQKLGMLCYLNVGNFKVTENGITVVQEAIMKAILDEYWDDDVKMHLTFDYNGEIADLNGRKIEIKYAKEKGSGRYLDVMTLLDMFSISTQAGKTKLNEQFKDLTFLDAINLDCMDFEYNLIVDEMFKDDQLNFKKMTQRFEIEYFLKKKRILN